jgi:hypothetical protein
MLKVMSKTIRGQLLPEKMRLENAIRKHPSVYAFPYGNYGRKVWEKSGSLFATNVTYSYSDKVHGGSVLEVRYLVYCQFT